MSHPTPLDYSHPAARLLATAADRLAHGGPPAEVLPLVERAAQAVRAETPAARPAVARMCAWTRRLEWDGRWLPVEEYLRQRFGVAVTHGICPAALAELQAEATGRPT